jgi:hypothetical protein
LIAWDLIRAGGATVYLVSGSPGAGPDGRLFDKADVTLPG